MNWFLACTCAVVVVSGCIDPTDLVPPTVIEDPSLPAMSINGTKLHVETFGDAGNPTLILLHGGPGSDSRELHAFAQPHNGYNLTSDYHLVIWDQRGAGLSERHDDASALNMSVYLEDLEALVDAVAPGRQVVLVAHSFGGMYAAMYMNTHPERIAGAVLLEPAPVSSELEDQVVSDESDLFAEPINDLIWAGQFISGNDHERADYAWLLASQTKTDGEPYPFYRYGAAAAFHVHEDYTSKPRDYTTRLNELEQGTLFIVGGNSGEFGEAFQEIQSAAFPDSEIEVVPGAYHDDIVWSQASESAAAIRTYLEDLDLSGARE